MAKPIRSLDQLANILVDQHSGRRMIVGLAGAPGSGKSTLAAYLKTALDRRRPGLSAVFPMDGFHFDDAVLQQRQLLSVKGAPETFDVGGLAHMLKRLAANEEDEIAVPVFDRSIETARAGGSIIPRSIGIIVAEGNYLLLKRPPWDRLDGLFDLTIMITTASDTLRHRLESRWRHFNLPEAEVQRKIETNDLPNGAIVMNESRESDFVIESEDTTWTDIGLYCR